MTETGKAQHSVSKGQARIAAAGVRLERLIAACSADCTHLTEAFEHLCAHASVYPFAAVALGGVSVGAAAGLGTEAQPGRNADIATARSGTAHRSPGATPAARAGALGTLAQASITPRPQTAFDAIPDTGQTKPKSAPTSASSLHAVGRSVPERGTTITPINTRAGALVGALIDGFQAQDRSASSARLTGLHATADPRTTELLSAGAPTIKRPQTRLPSAIPTLAAVLNRADARSLPHSAQAAAVPQRPSQHAPTLSAPPALGVPGVARLQALVEADRDRSQNNAPRAAGRGARSAVGGEQHDPAAPTLRATLIAPRVQSRLIPNAAEPALAATQPATPGVHAAPAADQLEAGVSSDELAHRLNLLLLDQAWLRGVDLS